MKLLPIKLRDLEADPESQCLKIKNKKKPVRLRKKEYLALQALFLSPGPVSERNIMLYMCESEYKCDKLVQVTISTLRKKMGRKGRVIIKRVRLYGYVIRERDRA